MDDLNKNNNCDGLSLLKNCADGRYIMDVVGHDVSRIRDKVPTAKEQFRMFFPIAVIVLVLCVIAFFYGRGSAPHANADNHINIDAISENATLRVLSVSDSVIITEKKEDNKKGITAWTKFTGTGEFVVDLHKSDFLIDEARKTVIVKTPEVSINKDSFTLDYNDIKPLFFANDFTNDSYMTGVGIAEKQLKEAYVRIFDQLYTNPYYYNSAKSAAEKVIKSLVLGLNKGVEGLNVIVEIGALSKV